MWMQEFGGADVPRAFGDIQRTTVFTLRPLWYSYLYPGLTGEPDKDSNIHGQRARKTLAPGQHLEFSTCGDTVGHIDLTNEPGVKTSYFKGRVVRRGKLGTGG